MLNKAAKTILSIFLLSLVIFTRSFVGIYLYDFRIGEYCIVLGLLSSIFFIFFERKNTSNKLLNPIKKLHLLLIVSFLVNIFLNTTNPLTIYIFKSSSYIWTIGYIYLGFLLNKIFSLKKIIQLLPYLLISIYYLQTYLFYKIAVIYECKSCLENELVGISAAILNFFSSYSDKFEPYKGTDLLIILIMSIFLINRKLNYTNKTFLMFISFTAAYFPLFLLKSRAASIAFSFFIIIELIYVIKTNKFSYKEFLIGIFVFVPIFLLSTSLLPEKDFNISDDSGLALELFINRNSFEEDKSLFYFENSRVYSSDGNLDWRLQIWQDVFEDLDKQETYFLGFGYNKKIPAMEIDSRTGQDGLNENVHNFIINVLGRGGVLSLSIFLLIKFVLFRNAILLQKNKFFISFLIPVIFASLFDASFENVQFPIFYYLFIGYIFAREEH